MPTTESLESKILLLTKCVEFYAEKDNYADSTIIHDNGHVAIETLKTIQKLDEINDGVEKAFKEIEDFKDDPKAVELMEEIKRLTEKFKS